MSEYQHVLTKYVCADCSPDAGDDRFKQEYVVFVRKGERCPLDFCPRCEGYLGFTEMGEYDAHHRILVPEGERL